MNDWLVRVGCPNDPSDALFDYLGRVDVNLEVQFDTLLRCALKKETATV